jgi:rubrerythrin
MKIVDTRAMELLQIALTQEKEATSCFSEHTARSKKIFSI